LFVVVVTMSTTIFRVRFHGYPRCCVRKCTDWPLGKIRKLVVRMKFSLNKRVRTVFVKVEKHGSNIKVSRHCALQLLLDHSGCNMLDTKAGRLDSRSGHIPKTWKRALAPCPASALTGGCKVAVHARCCHWFTNSSAFTAKPAAQGSGNGRRRSLAKGGQKPSINETELKYPISMAWLLLNTSCYFRPLRHNVLLHRCPH